MRAPAILLSLLAAATLAPALSAGADLAPITETKVERDTRMAWFREARFGMFIHWGIYSVSEGTWKNDTGYGEWLMEQAKILTSEYAGLAKRFNPTGFDAKAWVRIAKDAGMKYLVVTARHHDGFAMFPSKFSDWCISATPFKRDPLAELAAACKDAGIRFCVYYSIMDWHHPDWGNRRAWNDTAKGIPDPDRFAEFMKHQLTELVTTYHPALVWFDGQWEEPWTHSYGVDIYTHLRKLDPMILTNGRVEGHHTPNEDANIKNVTVGDYDTPEQNIPPFGFGPGVDWETCMTFNNHWSYNKGDHAWKSTTTLLHNLIDVASKGGNYLLNVGPTPEGLIPEASTTRLAEIGAWMKVNGESIHGSTASAFARLTWGRSTSKPGKLYLHVFAWPKDGTLLVPMNGTVSKGYLLAQPGKALKMTPGAQGLELKLPLEAPDANASVVVLNVPGEVKPIYVSVINHQGADGKIPLIAEDCDVTGGIKLNGNPCAIGSWLNAKDTVSWQVMVDKPGTFAVTLDHALGDEGNGNVFSLTVGDQALQGTLAATKGWDDYVQTLVGTITIPAAGMVTLTIKPASQPHSGLMNLRGVTLTPKAP